MRTRVRLLDTSLGPARATSLGPASPTVLVLGHGAGGGTEAFDLQVISRAVADAGHRVVLVDQPWRVAGRRIAPRPQVLDVAWQEALRRLRTPRLVVGGRSAGARVACRTADALGALAVVALAFPLHPPGRRSTSRADELCALRVPTLVVQGERDPFGSAAEVQEAAPSARVLAVAGADHGLRCGRSQQVTEERLNAAAAEIVAFLDGLG